MKTLSVLPLLVLTPLVVGRGIEQVLGTNEMFKHSDGTRSFQDGKCSVYLQSNGKAVTTVRHSVTSNHEIAWNSGDPLPEVGADYRMVMQGDGNLVIYHPTTNEVVYSTHTRGTEGDYFLAFLENDCVLSIFKGLFTDPDPELVWKNKRQVFKRGDRLGKGEIFNVVSTNKYFYVQPSDGNLLVKFGAEGDLRGFQRLHWASDALPNADTKDYYLKAREDGHLAMYGVDNPEYVYWELDLGVGNDCYKVGLDDSDNPIALPCQNIEQVLAAGQYLESNEGNKFFHGGRCCAYLQDNGKFVTGISSHGGKFCGRRIWQSGDPKYDAGYPPPVFRITMQRDGNLVVNVPGGVRGTNTIYYATHSDGAEGDYFLGMDDDCSVAIYPGLADSDEFPEPIWKSVRTELRRHERLGKSEILRFPEKDAYMIIQAADGHLTVRTGTNLSGDDAVVWASGATVGYEVKDYYLYAGLNGVLKMLGIGTPHDFEYWEKDLGVEYDCYIVKLNNNFEPVAVGC